MRKWLLKSSGMAFIAVGIFNYLYYGKTGELPDLAGHLGAYLLVVAMGAVAGISIVYSNIRLNAVISWRKSLGVRFLAGSLVQAAILAGIVLLGLELSKGLFPEPVSFETLKPEMIKLALLLFVLIIVNGVFDLSYFSFSEYSKGRLNQLKHEREQLELQYELLKTQLSPHYLFNSLNTISSLLDDSSEQAEQFIRRLVQSYQYLIASQDKKLVTVEEELAFVRAYLFLQKVRFGNALTHTISIGANKFSANIPPLTIQLLVENAIKHNDFSELDPMEIVIQEEEGNYICVTNENRGIVDEAASLQVGLANIQKRYVFFTDLPVRIVNDKLFSVSVPLLPHL